MLCYRELYEKWFKKEKGAVDYRDIQTCFICIDIKNWFGFRKYHIFKIVLVESTKDKYFYLYYFFFNNIF